jgi:DNA repair exonuclease SbcCD ATPase subunit
MLGQQGKYNFFQTASLAVRLTPPVIRNYSTNKWLQDILLTPSSSTSSRTTFPLSNQHQDNAVLVELETLRDLTLKNTIEQILKEEEVLKIFEVYGKMIGKNGISKLVLSSVIPIINYELGRLLDETCDFEVELEINDKNEVDFNLIKNNVVKKLRSGSGLETTISSLALRCVLGRISTLPKPNIIVFDEVLGKVANTNLDNVKIFFDKIKKMYEVILLISHNPLVMDWADKIVTVEKNNDISSLQVQ